MKQEKELLEEIVEKETLFIGQVFDTQLWEVTLPNGKKARREAVIHHGGVTAFALSPDGKVPLVRQHRVVAGEILWELPAGKREKGEEPLSAMKRELREEAGLTANSWEHLLTFYPTPAYCTEEIHVFLAKDTSRVSQQLDEDEFLQVSFFTMEELKTMIHSGQIKDGKTLIGIFLALEKLGKIL